MNTAPLHMLTRVAGLTETRAKAIIAYRQANGGFRCRKQLLKV
ncbi:unnamed protein product [Protopolystoma xenopodis]|uniref:Uncharacterized protein n=1 Tax=Protopolystoma xenopodis TaxID=117903 RepID=A0A3S4ZJS2_9PLAT|nr:unnamed protein product [Protopolystoma xenopodis]